MALRSLTPGRSGRRRWCLCGAEGPGDDPGPFSALNGRRDEMAQALTGLPIVSEARFIFAVGAQVKRIGTILLKRVGV
jgi:hypothetical protein